MNEHPIDPTLIDRLVDGELDPEARRALLRRLDAAPGGWRCCALAFLEAREFGLAARSWALEHAATAPKAPAPSPRRPSPARLAMAASIVAVAFLAGFAARGGTAGPVVEAGRPGLLAETGPEVAPRPAAEVEDVPSRPDPAPAEEEPPPAMPEYVKAQWSRLGYQVEHTHKLISMEEDGRRVTFPLDGYRLEFVGRPTY